MKLFHISDILTVTTGRLVSMGGIEAVYKVLGFLTRNPHLYTHQLPRVMEEMTPWLKAQFPALMKDAHPMTEMLVSLGAQLGKSNDKNATVTQWVASVRVTLQMPVMLPLYEAPEGWHSNIDAVEELKAMKGDENVVAVQV